MLLPLIMSNMNLLLLTIPVISLALVFLRYVLRRRYPVSVACWFCGEKTKVLYDFKNCWDCPNCEQYNGFNKDGSYNKPIPAQYDEGLNQPISCDKDEFLGGRDLLCEKCSQNQLLKVKQLANFEPYDEKHYDYEIEAYQRHLEKVYRLCMPCEIKVEKELQIQNEAISKRLGYLDQFRSFIDNSMQEENILHSSYTDRRANKQIVISFILHSVSLLCSVLIGAKEMRLDGDRPWQKCLLYIHPLLLWIDKNVQMLAFLGLFSNLLAKLCLGKYRLHIIDVVSCPIWLLVLLSHIGYLPFDQTGSVLSIICMVFNCITCTLCLGIRRGRRNKSDMRVTRMSLDASNISDSVSSVSPFSSVSQTGLRSNATEPATSAKGVTTSSRLYNLPEPDSSDDKTDEELTQLHGVAKEADSCHSNIEDTAAVLNAFSLGEPTSKQPYSDSGIFSTVSHPTSTSNLLNQSVSNNLRCRQFGQGKSLITPAIFNHSSTPDKHRSSPLPKFGLFSTPSSESPSPSFLDRPSSPFKQSAFMPTQFLSAQRHSFTPERPASPVVTSFGEPPFSNIPLQSDRLSQCSATMSRSSKCSYVRPMINETKRQGQKSKRLFDMTELSDNEDNVSDITSISRQCPVDSTSEMVISRKENVSIPWWRHPGFVGFFLGGSVVANVILVSQITLSYYVSR